MASISDPFVLHSYAAASMAGPSRLASNNVLPHMQAVGSWNDSCHISLTVQGDGVHIFDRSNHHPIASYTLGPSTLFYSRSVTRVSADGKRRTYVSVVSAPDVPGGGKTAWIWPEGSEDSSARNTIELPFPAEEFLFVASLPSRVFVSSTNGTAALCSADLDILSVLPCPYPTTGRARSFLFPRQSGALHGSTRCQAVLVTFFGNEEGSFGFRIARVSDDEMYEDGWVALEDILASDVISVSCEGTGHGTVLLATGKWYSFQMTVSPTVSYTLLATSNDVSLAASSPNGSSASVLSLSSSHVLFASMLPSSRQLKLELWDVKYPVLLVSTSSPLPSTLPEKAGVELSHASPGQALVVITPAMPSKSSPGAKGRSAVFIVPYTTPPESNLVNALGRLEHAGDYRLSEDENALVKDIGEALRRGASEIAENIFFKWIKGRQPSLREEDKGIPTIHPGSGRELTNGQVNGHTEPDQSDEEDDSDGNRLEGWRARAKGAPMLSSGARPPDPKKSKVTKKPLELPLELVEQLINLLLAPATPSLPAHSKILRHLITEGVVSNRMVHDEHKLVDVLVERDDWRAVYIALRYVTDMPESDVIRVLKAGLAMNRPRPAIATHDDATPRDNLGKVLGAVIAAPVTRPSLRVALKEQMTDLGDVMQLLVMLEGWLSLSLGRAWQLDPDGGMAIDVLFKPKPKLDDVLSFLEAVLDTFYISLLQYPPAHPVLRRLSAVFAPQLSLATEYERLRGPLELFAKQKQKRIEQGRQKAPVSRFEDARRKRREQEELDLLVGQYRVEEFVL